MTTLSHWRKRAGKGGEATAASPAGVDVKTPPVEQVAKMDPPTFLSRFAMLLVANPPAKEDAPMVEKMAKLGIVPGRAFDASSLDAMATKGLEEGYKLGVESIAAAARGAIGDIRNGWTIHLDLGRYGLNYGKRAVIASLGLGASAPEDAINPTSHLDGTGKLLNGAKKYVVHFDAGKTPPTEAFWSLTAYNDKHLLVANPIDRFAIGSRDKLNVNADGSIDVYVQNPSPGKDKEANWLPAPKDSFNVIMRIYWPKPDVLEGRWAPPPIRPVG